MDTNSSNAEETFEMEFGSEESTTTEAAFILDPKRLQKSPVELFLPEVKTKSCFRDFIVDIEWSLVPLFIFLSFVIGILIAVIYTRAQSMALGKGPWWFLKICKYTLKCNEQATNFGASRASPEFEMNELGSRDSGMIDSCESEAMAGGDSEIPTSDQEENSETKTDVQEATEELESKAQTSGTFTVIPEQ